jgi:energy-coupling factor transporter ATP-binding protein EcfA2
MGASLTKTCQCQATDTRGNICGRFYDPKFGGRCSCGAFNWAETATAAPHAPSRRRVRRVRTAASTMPPRATDADDEDAWDSDRERGPCVACGLPERVHEAPGRGGPACDVYEPPFVARHVALATPAKRDAAHAPGIRILRADDADELVVTEYPAVLSTVAGGFAHGKIHAILGSAGAGKSTLAAQAASAIAGRHGAPLWWLDGDQNSMGLVLRSFALARSEPHNLRVPQAEDGADLPWQRAFEIVPQDALVMVVDSLETWAPRSDQARGELLRALRMHGCRFKFVIAAAKADGSVAGAGLLERAWDASIFVEKRAIRTGKCRWSGESTWERYRDRPGGVRLCVRRVVDDEDEDDDQIRPTVLGAEPERHREAGTSVGRLGGFARRLATRVRRVRGR